MATSKHRYSHSESRKDEHLLLLDELDNFPLTDSCCDICQCDCYNSHRSLDPITTRNHSRSLSPSPRYHLDTEDFFIDIEDDSFQEAQSSINYRKPSIKRKTLKIKKNSPMLPLLSAPRPSKSSTKIIAATSTTNLSEKSRRVRVPRIKRSKSVNSLVSCAIKAQSELPSARGGFTRDCEIIQDLLSAVTGQTQTPRQSELQVSESTGHSHLGKLNTSNKTLPRHWPRINDTNPNSNSVASTGRGLADLSSLKLCDSLASLCLAPTVKEAFQRVPAHDKKILNCMANKRSEKILAKENAWLAKKYWENERYERELLKCEQMEEYKRAVRDKQFQDYLMTKRRLNDIARRDYAQLQRLRESLYEKDERTKRRLDAIRTERDILVCQRRCDELRKSEAANLLQEEHQIDENLRKRELCQKLNNRLIRADHARHQMHDGYLRRLRYDNHVEQLMHEENWRETKQSEQNKRQQLQDHISRKRQRSQRFVENRQRHHESITKTAKISANLRELVRNNVMPDGFGLMGQMGTGSTLSCNGGGSNMQVPAALGLLLIDRPLSKLPIK